MDFWTFLRFRPASEEVFSLIPSDQGVQGTRCDYSVVIPAYNEEKYIAQTLEALQQAQKAMPTLSGECIVVDNQCTDRTVEIAKEFGCRVVSEPVHQIARVRNTGAHASRGSYLIFVDADTVVPPATLKKALVALQEKGVGCGGAKLGFDQNHGRWFSGVLLPAIWNLISQTFRLFAGSFIFCRRDLFFLSGGFPETHFAGEEIVLSRKLKKQSAQKGLGVLVISSPPVVSSARKLEWYSDWAIFKMILPLLGLPFFLRSQKACRFWYRRPSKD